jgi:hypothetical protein
MDRGTTNTNTASEPTEFMRFVSQSLGDAVAQKIEQRFGGHRFYIPIIPEEHHALSKAIGLAEAQHIAVLFGSGYVEVPLGASGSMVTRRSLIEQACIDGRTSTSIVRDFGCCSRTVYKIKARLRREGRLP